LLRRILSTQVADCFATPSQRSFDMLRTGLRASARNDNLGGTLIAVAARTDTSHVFSAGSVSRGNLRHYWQSVSL